MVFYGGVKLEVFDRIQVADLGRIAEHGSLAIGPDGESLEIAFRRTSDEWLLSLRPCTCANDECGTWLRAKPLAVEFVSNVFARVILFG